MSNPRQPTIRPANRRPELVEGRPWGSFLVMTLSAVVLLFAIYDVPARLASTGAAAGPANASAGDVDVTRGTGAGPASLFSIDAVALMGHVEAPIFVGSIPDALRVPHGQTLGFTGWALDPKTKLPAKDVAALVDSTLVFIGRVGSPRPDVVNVFKAPNALNCGFDITVPTVDLAPGKHRLRFRVVSSDGASYYSANASFVIDVIERRGVRAP